MWEIFGYDRVSFEKFIYENSILSTTAGVLVAYSAKDMIQSFVGDLLLPGIYFIFVQNYVNSKFVSKVFEPVNKLDLPRFFSNLISFMVILFITYLTIQHIIKKVLPYDTLSPSPSLTSSPSPTK
jgi:large-conductance mechanosensitive channel